MEIEDIEPDLANLKNQKNAIENEIKNLKLQTGTLTLSDKEIKEVIDGTYVHEADPEMKKRAVHALFDEIRILPKKGRPWERFLEFKGTGMPLTGIKVASPRGFEPLSPA